MNGLFALLGHGNQSALNPAGHGARVSNDLLLYFIIPLGTAFLLVMAIAIGSLFRRHRGIKQEPLEGTHVPSPDTERRLTRWVGGATAVTALMLLSLIVLSVSAGKAISDRAMPAGGLAIEVTGTQWWWEVRYVNSDPSLVFITANEIHVPTHRAVLIRGTSLDVIHSFWVPGLQGKRDLIPSRVTTQWFEAEKPGRFRGQCAEFCGAQHAHMGLWVVAEDEPQFSQWVKRQLESSVTPATDSQRRGQQVFLGSACVLCHTIRGTSAAGQVAPDLTHVGSRFTIAAGTLANNRGNMAGWIVDPQNAKPGNHMASVPLRSEDLQSLLDYMESLK